MSATATGRTETRLRWDAAMARSRRLCSCSTRLLAASKEARVSAERSRRESVSRRADRDDVRTGVEAESEVRSFIVNGFVDGRPAYARFVDGLLWCTTGVALRADVVVAMGETFDPGDGSPKVKASLDTTPAAALLTVMRAFSHVSSVELGLGPAVHDDD